MSLLLTVPPPAHLPSWMPQPELPRRSARRRPSIEVTFLAPPVALDWLPTCPDRVPHRRNLAAYGRGADVMHFFADRACELVICDAVTNPTTVSDANTTAADIDDELAARVTVTDGRC